MGKSCSTQREKIKELLWNRFGQWVPLPEILPFAAQYNARLYELRRELRPRGYEIFNKTETQPDGTKFSWFRLDYRAAIDVSPIRKSAPPLPASDDDEPVKCSPSRHEIALRFERANHITPTLKQDEPAADLPLFAEVQS